MPGAPCFSQLHLHSTPLLLHVENLCSVPHGTSSTRQTPTSTAPQCWAKKTSLCLHPAKFPTHAIPLLIPLSSVRSEGHVYLQCPAQSTTQKVHNMPDKPN